MNLLVVFVAYLTGSIPSGYWIAKYFYKVDVTATGSGNIGATNVARVLSSKSLFFLIFSLDASKAFLCLKFFETIWGTLGQPQILLAASMLLLGNMFSCFMNFKGGKGVSTFVGFLAFFSFPLAILFVGVWILSLATFKQSDCSSLTATALTPIFYTFFAKDFSQVGLIFLIFATILIFWRHKKNVLILLSGVEKNQ